MYQVLADTVLLIHAGIVVFVVGGLALILVGGSKNWRWVRSTAFRLLHLAAIGVVVFEAWAGLTCPLTTLENWLRQRSGQTAYGTGFIEHWVGSLLFHDAPAWVFTILYTLFALLVVATWRLYPPSRSGGSSSMPRRDRHGEP